MQGVLAEQQLLIYNKTWRETVRQRRIEQILGKTMEMDCLAVGGPAPLHYYLRRRGGRWSHAALTSAAHQNLCELVDGPVAQVEDMKLPFDDGQFDRLVLTDVMEHVQDDRAFIAECHRVLKSSGIFIVNTTHAKRHALLPLIRKLLDVRDDRIHRYRTGYTESELFDILKDGFDVEEMKNFSRVMLESATLLLAFIGSYLPGRNGPDPVAGRLRVLGRYSTWTLPLAWCAAQLDLLLFFTRGYQLLARAKRRVWRPRRTPILYDGRSIAEATLRAKIGTAAPF